MTEALLISNVLVWVVLLALGIAVFALARQIGVLHERIRPVGALSLGKAIKAGDAAPAFLLPSLTGGSIAIGGTATDNKTTLLFFLSATCPVCKTLLPILNDISTGEQSWLRVVFASDGEEAEHQRFIAQHGLERFPYLLSTDVGLAYQISKLPYGVLISSTGIVLTHGLVNNREHLESLFEAKQKGVASLQDYHHLVTPTHAPPRQGAGLNGEHHAG